MASAIKAVQNEESGDAPKDEKKGVTKGSGKGRRGEKDFINEDLFGKNRSMTDVPAEEGITHLKVHANEIGNIPGMIDHWKADLKRRKTEIINWQKLSFVQRAAGSLRGKALSPEATGEEIAKFHPTKAAMTCMKNLKRDPTDMMSRLELVSIVCKSGRELPIETYRTLLLQATIACSFQELSNVGLQNALWIQDTYFTKLYHKCKHEVTGLDSKLKKEGGKASNAYTQQEAKLREYIGQVYRNMEIIRAYQKHASRALDNQAVYHATLNFDEIASYAMEEESGKKHDSDKKRDEKRKNLIKRASEILLLLRTLPLLDDQAKRLTDQLKKTDPNDPVLHFLPAKVAMSGLVFSVSKYQGGERTASVRQEIQEKFKEAYHHYGVAVRKVGKVPKTKIEFTILIEYASLIHYFYKVARNIIGLPLPKEWLATAFTKAEEALSLSQESGQTDGLLKEIQQDRLAEGLD